jgi:predicted AlkP superfamily pyrophosphatase or phosphodiesterase
LFKSSWEAVKLSRAPNNRRLKTSEHPMTYRNRPFWNLACLLIAAGCFNFSPATFAAPKPPRVKHVFIISFDQGNPDLIQRTELPAFHQMTAAGAHTWEAYTIVPSLTLPSHTSMLTGVGIQKHQIAWNDYQPDKGFVNVPTIFSLAKERGLKTAMFVGKEKFKHLELPGTIDALVWPQPDDDAKSVAKAFAVEFSKAKPNLTFIHFRDPDTVGHKTGAYSPEKIQALKDCDEALQTIKNAVADAGVLADSVFILTADHGSHDSKNKEGKTIGSHGDSRSEDVLIPWVAWGKGVKKNFTITAPVLQYDTAATALWLLKVPLPEHFWGRPVTSAFK